MRTSLVLVFPFLLAAACQRHPEKRAEPAPSSAGLVGLVGLDGLIAVTFAAVRCRRA